MRALEGPKDPGHRGLAGRSLAGRNRRPVAEGRGGRSWERLGHADAVLLRPGQGDAPGPRPDLAPGWPVPCDRGGAPPVGRREVPPGPGSPERAAGTAPTPPAPGAAPARRRP